MRGNKNAGSKPQWDRIQETLRLEWEMADDFQATPGEQQYGACQ